MITAQQNQNAKQDKYKNVIPQKTVKEHKHALMVFGGYVINYQTMNVLTAAIQIVILVET